MMDYSLVSVVVPIYKVEDYVEACIKSVEKQDYPNWELILVDDGSPDKSGEICDICSSRNSKIKVIHQENQGVSAARRNGLLSCSGKWVFFLDGDDMLTPNSLSTLVSYCEEYGLDLCIGGFDILTSKGSINRGDKGRFRIVNNEDYINGVSECRFMMALWGKLYKREVLLKTNIIIERSITNNEDYMYNLFLAPHLNRIGVTEDSIYVYNRIREERASNNKCDHNYWKHFLEYLRLESPKYDVPFKYSVKARTYKIYMLMRNDSSFDVRLLDDEINEIKQIDSKKDIRLWQKLTIYLCNHPNSLLYNIIRFHPTLILYWLKIKK